ncbi:MAG: DNA-processing protein DprA [Clostridiales bacterium]|nr:DNA-processing protein DprA [Clostridiales bacterium]
MNTQLLLSRLAFSLLPGATTRLADIVTDNLGDISGFFDITECEVKAIEGLPIRWAAMQERYKAVEKAKAELEFLNRNNEVKALWYTDEAFPSRLLDADRPPVLVYTLGKTQLNNSRTVGIVGTRHATSYGTSFTERLVEELKAKVPDIATVSGLAYGIDVAAHTASLKAGVPTVGIVAHGLTRVYPAVHRDIAARMVKNGGMLLSDYSHDTTALGPNFLARNRLIAALSDALIVVESGERGGAIATARLARKSNRKVLTVPGRTTDNYSRGCNAMLVNGTAQCIQCCDDLLKIMNWPTVSSSPGITPTHEKPDIVTTLTHEEKLLLYNVLTVENCDNDSLTAITGMTAPQVMTLMIGLEMRGIIASTPANRYQVLQTIDPIKLLTKI